MQNETEEQSRGGVFTRFVREAGDRRNPDPALFNAVWEGLRAGLVRELKRRGLWLVSPHFVGVLGDRCWTAETLEELTADCFQYVFIERLVRLQAQLSVKPNIDGLVWVNIRHLLHDKQRQHDPLGYRIYSALRSVVREAVDKGRIFVIAGDRRIRNDSLLAFSVTADLLNAQDEQERDLSGIAQRWADELLPELVTTVGAGQRHVRRRLARRLNALEDQGFAVFQFGQLVTPLKKEVRARWFALFESELGKLAMEVDDERVRHWARSVGPERSIEHRDSYEKLVNCVAAGLANLDIDQDLRSYLDRLWTFLCAWAVDLPDTMEKDDLPSARSLARTLDIPRARIPELFNRLGQLVESCRANQAHSFVKSE